MDEKEEKDTLQRLTVVEQSTKSAHHRIDKIEELIASIQSMTVEIKHMREDINRLDDKVGAIEAKPAKRWEALIAAIVGAVAGGVGTAIVGKLIGG